MTTKHTRKPTAAGTLALLVVAAGSALALAQDASAERPLVSLVGSDAGLCVEIRDLAVHRRRFRESEAFRRLSNSPLVARFLKSREFGKLQAAREHLEKLSGKPFGRLFDDLLGRSVVLAVYPREKGEAAGIFLTRASGAKALQEALRVWQEAEPNRTSTALKHRGVAYFRRSGRDKPLYYAPLDDVLALSDREEMIQKVIALRQSKPAGDRPLTALASYREAMKSLPGRPVVAAFVNPRRWDRAFGLSPTTGEVRRDLPARLWRSTQWLAAGVRIEDGLVLDAIARFDRATLPQRWKDSRARKVGPPKFLQRVPAEALIAVAGRFDPSGLRRIIQNSGASNRPSDLQKLRGLSGVLLGVDPVDDLLPRLSESYGSYLIGRTSAAGADAAEPFDLLTAVELADDAGGPGEKWRARFDAGLGNAIGYLVTTYNLKAAQTPNMKPWKLRTKKQGNVTVRWIESLQGYQPAIALTPQFLVAASHPELIAAFRARREAGSLLANAAFRHWRERYFDHADQLLYVNAALLRAQLKKNAAALTARWSKSGGASRKAVADRLNVALQVLDLFDAAFVAGELRQSRLRLTAGCVVEGRSGTRGE